jgi:hypothetical protein
MHEKRSETRRFLTFAPHNSSILCRTSTCFSKRSFELVQAMYRYSLVLFPSLLPFVSVVHRSSNILSQHMLFKLGLLWHPTLWGHGILAANVLLILHVLLVCNLLLLFRCHVVRWHASTTAWHACLWSWYLRVVHVFRRVGVVISINAILIAWCRLGRVKACL